MARKPLGARRRRLTRRGSYLLILFVSFAGVFFFGGRVVYGPFFLCLFLPVLSLGHLLLTKRRVRTGHTLEKTHVRKGEETAHLVRVKNMSRLPAIPAMAVAGFSAYPAAPGEAPAVGLLPPREALAFFAPVAFPYRGAYEIEAPVVRAADMLGLFTARLPMPPPTTLVVCPRVPALRNCARLEAHMAGTSRHTRHSHEEMSTVSDTRTYQYGDPLNRIHWKLSAQKGELISRLYEDENSPALLFVLDTTPPREGAEGADEAVDRLVECLVALLSFCLRQGWSVRLEHSRDGRPIWHEQTDRASFDRLFFHLAALPFAETVPFATFLRRGLPRADTFADVLVFTCSLDGDTLGAIARLCPSSRPPVVVYAPPRGAPPPPEETGALPVCVVPEGADIPGTLEAVL